MENTIKTICEYLYTYEFMYIFLSLGLICLIFAIFLQKVYLRIIFLMFFSIFISLSVAEFVSSYSLMPIDIESVKNNEFQIDNKVRTVRCAKFLHKNSQMFFCYDKYIEIDLKSPDNKKLREVQYSIFSNGFRQTESNVNGKERYIFLGCSFTFGEFVNDKETLPYYFSKLNNFENYILNCGVRSHSTNRSLSILNSNFINDINNNKHIDHFFYSVINDHIRRNFRIAGRASSSDNWLYKNGKWKRVPQPFGKIKVIFANSYIFRKMFVDLIEKKYSNFYAYYLIDSLVEIDKIIKDKYNSKLTIIVWPEFTEKFITKLKETNIDLVFLPKYFIEREYKAEFDEHPGPKANEEIAEILYNHINKK